MTGRKVDNRFAFAAAPTPIARQPIDVPTVKKEQVAEAAATPSCADAPPMDYVAQDTPSVPNVPTPPEVPTTPPVAPPRLLRLLLLRSSC